MTNNIINTNTDSARNANYIAARITRPTLLSEIDPTVMGIIGAKDGIVSDVIFDVNTFEYEDGRANGDIVGMIINQGDEMSPDYCIDVRKDVTKLTDLEHLSEDFNKLHEDFRGKIESQEVIISMDDLPNANDNEIIL